MNTTETSGRKIAKGKGAAFDRSEYGRLLAKVAPEKITTKKQHREISKIVDDLMRKGDGNRTPEEEKLMVLLFTLVAEYERAQYPDYRGTPADVIALFNNSRSYISDVLKGRRGLSKVQAVKLAKYFDVRVEVFL
jgi:antitoxin component HigA of HigAB toxin-antitoxin module